ETLEDNFDTSVRNPLAAKLLRRTPMANLPLVLAEPWEVVDHLSGDVLPVQGPPGSGKSFSGARMILRLHQAGKKVGITANSHAVIDNLMRKVQEAAREQGVAVPKMVRIQKDAPKDSAARVVADAKDALAELKDGRADVVGGTSWVWASAPAERSLHTLVVDEAGQMSLANVVACASAAENMILLGDPQQLAQPTQATHPEGTAASALTHFIGDRPTLSDEQGLFLKHTYRLHPDICAFTSELYYAGRLESAPDREKQRLDGVGEFGGSGLRIVHARHEGCRNKSLSEVEVIKSLVERLRGGSFSNHLGVTRKLLLSDLLVVAPFNSQVNALRAALPTDVQVGTVDKFQGREAPVVIYSMTSSSAEDAPRGMSFLYDPHRLNVAVSRAQAMVILVATPVLFEPPVKSPRQMELANAMTRFAELAKVVAIPSQEGA
ncbi:MAG TPA: ATP-binding protein, partial [Polyangiaceae bacterium]|nr:ATP-binding protein [Polyangiaceae bacterium]